jgi:acyl-CoA thioester hydrolase
MSFELSLHVLADDIDEQGHVNNIIYLRWVQDVATAHWQELATTEEQAAIQWVVVRHEIDYHASALPGDELLIQTRLGKAAGLTFERHVDILRLGDGRTLARARTLWCPLNPQTKRPQRLPPRLRALFSADESA